MKRLLILAALLAGCDDESIPAKVAAVQLHGFVEAQIDCDGSLTRTTTPFNTVGFSGYRAQKLIDGSCFTGGHIGSAPVLIARSAEGAAVCLNEQGGASIQVEDGLIIYINGETYTGSVETECTGFNLEAFGVE
jgi:hypothetical protein